MWSSSPTNICVLKGTMWASSPTNNCVLKGTMWASSPTNNCVLKGTMWASSPTNNYVLKAGRCGHRPLRFFNNIYLLYSVIHKAISYALSNNTPAYCNRYCRRTRYTRCSKHTSYGLFDFHLFTKAH